MTQAGLHFVIDIGNQDTVLGALDSSGKVTFTARIPSLRRSSSELEQWLDFLCRKYAVTPSQIETVSVASVVPQANDLWVWASEAFLHRKPWFLTPKSVMSLLKIDVDRPEEVGPDRLANAIAVRSMTQKLALVLDFGTAATFDVVTEKGEYIGGIIAPGMSLALESLGRATALLPQLSLNQRKEVIGRNTVDAMLSGAYWGYASMVEGLLERVQEELKNRFGQQAQVFATGGQAEMICRAVRGAANIQLDSHLTLKGIFHAAQRAHSGMD